MVSFFQNPSDLAINRNTILQLVTQTVSGRGSSNLFRRLLPSWFDPELADLQGNFFLLIERNLLLFEGLAPQARKSLWASLKRLGGIVSRVSGLSTRISGSKCSLTVSEPILRTKIRHLESALGDGGRKGQIIKFGALPCPARRLHSVTVL